MKDEFVYDLEHDFGTKSNTFNFFVNALETNLTFGAVGTLSMPTTVEEAIIVQGQVAVNINNAFLVPLGGLPYVDLFMHVGQHNRILLNMLVAILEYKKNPDYS